MTLVRMARWTEDFTLDFAPGVRLGERDGVSGSFCLGSEGTDGAYSFLNMMAVSDGGGCHGRGNSVIELTRWAFFEASSEVTNPPQRERVWSAGKDSSPSPVKSGSN
jgi:hypothetical protein